MNAGTIERIETNVERAAAALFAAAVGYAAFAVLRDVLPPPQLAGCAGIAALAAYLLCNRIMTATLATKDRFPLQVFDVRELEFGECGELLLTEADRLAGELVLTDADRLESPAAAVQEPLLLEDALPPTDSDSRVVRLFDRRAMPTPGELKSRIDDHLAGASEAAPQSDAAKALADALAQLRRSLR